MEFSDPIAGQEWSGAIVSANLVETCIGGSCHPTVIGVACAGGMYPSALETQMVVLLGTCTDPPGGASTEKLNAT